MRALVPFVLAVATTSVVGAQTPTELLAYPITRDDSEVRFPSGPVLGETEGTPEEFHGAFFSRVEQRPYELEVGGETKTYAFPTFYGDVTSAVAVFPTSAARVQAKLPEGVRPATLLPGVAAVVISSYRYGSVLGIKPYNEVSIAVPVLVGDAEGNLLELMRDPQPGFGIYVLAMPVTTEENRVRGVEIWGLPKRVRTIELGSEGYRYVTRVEDAQGRSLFELTVPRWARGPLVLPATTYTIYSQLDGELRAAETTSRASAALISVAPRPGTLKVASADAGPEAALLRELGLNDHSLAIQIRYTKGESLFTLPRSATQGAGGFVDSAAFSVRGGR